MRFEVRPASAEDLPAAIDLLKQARLPTEDLSSAHLALMADGDRGPLAVIGMQSYDHIALLRSLVVSPLARGEGIGKTLVAALEAAAIERGTRELWLLTIDADAFFSKLGFSVRRREDAPAAIRDSVEFSSLCPADAILMSKCL